jgi:hypothetical protein
MCSGLQLWYVEANTSLILEVITIYTIFIQIGLAEPPILFRNFDILLD